MPQSPGCSPLQRKRKPQTLSNEPRKPQNASEMMFETQPIPPWPPQPVLGFRFKISGGARLEAWRFQDLACRVLLCDPLIKPFIQNTLQRCKVRSSPEPLSNCEIWRLVPFRFMFRLQYGFKTAAPTRC